MAHTLTLLFLFAVSYFGYEYVMFVHELEEVSVDLGMPMWIVYLVIPVSFFFAAYRVGEKIVEIIKTPAEDVIKVSEAEMIVQQMSEGENDKILKDVEKKTGGLL
jgi:C4-dicarboxylate transporter DctQ subunit